MWHFNHSTFKKVGTFWSLLKLALRSGLEGYCYAGMKTKPMEDETFEMALGPPWTPWTKRQCIFLMGLAVNRKPIIEEMQTLMVSKAPLMTMTILCYPVTLPC